jgi:hypothetical protein
MMARLPLVGLVLTTYFGEESLTLAISAHYQGREGDQQVEKIEMLCFV